MQRSALMLCCTVATLLACESSTEVAASTHFTASPMTGAKEKPTAVTTNGNGTFSATLSKNTFSFSGSWTGLSGAATMAHIHGPADADATAGILIDFSALPSGSTGTLVLGASGSVIAKVDLALGVTSTVSGDSLKKLLNAGLLYVNVHTAANPNGEIRGQIVKQ